MAVTKDDFEKIWASTSPLTPYQFNDAQYKEGWNFVGSTPPSRQMWDAFMQNADEKLQYLYQHEDIPLGHEYFTFNPNVPQGSLPLFGGEYSRETYSDLWAWVQEQTGYLKTEAEWQTLATANNGNVPYYSDGDGSTTFRVPSLKCWVKGANGTVSEVGSYLEAGLPNIEGSYEITVSGIGKVASAYGAFSHGSGTASFRASDTTQAASSYTNGMFFNASASNSIYGNSNTVQPPSIIGMWLVKAYGVIVDTGTIDEQAYIDDRYNAMKQYVDDKIDTVSTYELSMSPVNPTGKAYFTKKGNMCMVYFDGISDLPSGGTTLPASIPESFRPITVTRTVHVDANNKRIMLSLGQNGDVYFYNYGSAITTLQPFYKSLTYICAD